MSDSTFSIFQIVLCRSHRDSRNHWQIRLIARHHWVIKKEKIHKLIKFAVLFKQLLLILLFLDSRFLCNFVHRLHKIVLKENLFNLRCWFTTQKIWKLLFLLFGLLLSSLLFLMMLLHIIYHPLLSLNVLKHELRFRQSNIIGENFWVFFIKFKYFWESLDWFLRCIASLHKLTHIVKDEVVFENRDCVGGLVIDDICDYLRVVVFSWGKIFLFKILLQHILDRHVHRLLKIRTAKLAVSNWHVENLKYLSVSFQNHVGILS